MRAKAILLATGLLLASVPLRASSSPLASDTRNLEWLGGCFSVTYQFVEDGVRDAFSESYGLMEPVTEWIDTTHQGHQITLLHFSITENDRAVPHFHEIWTHRSDKQSWTQEIWSRTPADENRELRYRCTAPWELNRWECYAGKAPKPFRDEGAPFGFDRTDYAWLERGNILLVTRNGWVHNQHNKKLSETGELVSYELGWITYRRLDETRCKAAVAKPGE